MPRTILHLDLDAFFCAVEEQRDPSLAGKAFAVGGRPGERGVVASCSYPARRYGVHSAMPMGQAVKLCPDLIIVPSHFDAYRAMSHRVMAHLNSLTPLVEQISIDEAFLDVTGVPGAGRPLAERLQATINQELNVPVSLGVATNKLVAKIANNVGKDRARYINNRSGPPNAIEVVPPGDEAAFLAPLGVRELWGVGPRTAERLEMMNIHTIGDLARWNEDDLATFFGKNGIDMARHARGIDDRPVETDQEAKSISKEITFTRDVRDREALRKALRRMSDGVGLQLRRHELCGTTVKLKLRWADFTTLSRQLTTPQPIDQDADIYHAALTLFDSTWIPGRAVRLIGVGISGLETTRRQLELWQAPESEQQRKLQSTLDAIRIRFGEDVIRRGSDVKPPKS